MPQEKIREAAKLCKVIRAQIPDVDWEALMGGPGGHDEYFVLFDENIGGD